MSKNSETGKIYRIDPIETNSKTGYQSRKVFLDCSFTRNGETDYNYLCFTFSGDKMYQLDRFQPGQIVTIEYFMKGRFYQKQDGSEGFFQDPKGFSIQPYQRRQQQPLPQNSPQGYVNPANGAQYPYQQQPVQQTYSSQAPYGQVQNPGNSPNQSSYQQNNQRHSDDLPFD